MPTVETNRPTVMIFSGHDPSGGAGLQADIESIAANGCLSASVITALTTQNFSTFLDIQPQKSEDFKRQAYLLLEERSIAAIKIGMLGSLEITKAIIDILEEEQNIPIILDPILTASVGTSFINAEILELLTEYLIPNSTIITPNSKEILQLCGNCSSIEEAVNQLQHSGCKNILVTGEYEKKQNIINTLYSATEKSTEFIYKRIEGEFHGSGCTLTSAIAAKIALDNTIVDAVSSGLEYTWQCINRNDFSGYAQSLPNRLNWLFKA